MYFLGEGGSVLIEVLIQTVYETIVINLKRYTANPSAFLFPQSQYFIVFKALR